jgi:uncharacterized repeat protein (TIGR03803 family)
MVYNKFLVVTTFAVTMVALLFVAPRTLRAASHEKVLHSFQNATDGCEPQAGLISDLQGNLYGTTSRGGQLGHGRVFELQRSGKGHWREKVLSDLQGGGSFPQGGLIFDRAGSLYGMTAVGGDSSCGSGYGCGVVFELSPKSDGGWRETVLYSFTGNLDGAYPVGDLVSDAAGNLYGATQEGGNSTCGSQSCGTIFKLTRNGASWTESVIYSFNEATGQAAAGPIVDSAGTLYGTTYNGGGSKNCYQGCGTVFELKPVDDGWKASIVYSFQGGGNGYFPQSSLVLDSQGNLYGGLYRGGNGGGVIFELRREHGRWQEHLLYNFCTLNNCADGARPVGLTMDKNGTLYGTTEDGGEAHCGDNGFGGCGTVFKLARSRADWKETVLYRFEGGPSDGEYPFAGVISDAEGRLYGTTSGGARGNECTSGNFSGCGTVFELVD